MINDVILSVSDFVALLNQTLEFAYPNVTIDGELASYRVSKNKWVYFDLKDELASVKFFGTVYQLPGPLEEGMTLRVKGVPRLHPQYGFSLTIQSILPVGEGTIRRAAALLQAKLEAEGLFDPLRKRILPDAPIYIGLITSSESAAYADFIKIINARWGGVVIELADVQVQGDASPAQIVQAIDHFNQEAHPPEVLVIIRGGGSAEDLSAFSTEQVTRAVAGSRIPTLVAIGHEIDVSLAEMAADKRASTPSNAAELLVPDRQHVLQNVSSIQNQLTNLITNRITVQRSEINASALQLNEVLENLLRQKVDRLDQKRKLLEALSPQLALRRGYAIIKMNGTTIRSIKQLHQGDNVKLTLSDGDISAKIS